MTSGPSDSRRKPASGYVLAGGASSRFGQDKALAEVAGRPMLGHQCALLELVVERVADLGGPFGPIGLAKRDVADLHLAAPGMPDAHIAVPVEQAERERDLDEDGKQDGLDGHGASRIRGQRSI